MMSWSKKDTTKDQRVNPGLAMRRQYLMVTRLTHLRCKAPIEKLPQEIILMIIKMIGNASDLFKLAISIPHYTGFALYQLRLYICQGRGCISKDQAIVDPEHLWHVPSPSLPVVPSYRMTQLFDDVAEHMHDLEREPHIRYALMYKARTLLMPRLY